MKTKKSKKNRRPTLPDKAKNDNTMDDNTMDDSGQVANTQRPTPTSGPPKTKGPWAGKRGKHYQQQVKKVSKVYWRHR